MAISDTVDDAVKDILAAAWNERDGIVVPTTESIVLRNGAVNVEATYVYADLMGSSDLAQKVRKTVAAKIVRSYLSAATRLLRHYGGEIRSFDGDRVMAIFMGTSKNTSAVRAGLAINWAVREVLRPRFKAQWKDIETYWTANHGVGVDTGQAMVVRGGVRDNNDLISIGPAPNIAAKLSGLRIGPNIYITDAVYNGMNEANKLSSDGGKSMWSRSRDQAIGGKTVKVMGSSWHWKP